MVISFRTTRTIALLTATAILAISLLPLNKAEAYVGGRLIDNSVFLDANSMSKSSIQSFLESKNSGLATREYELMCYGSDSKEREWYTDAGAECDEDMPASHIIYYAAQIYGLSPKVILSTLQKEQSLITTQNPTSWQLDQAMGYGCPTSGSCGTSSFPAQIDSGTWALRWHYERANGNNSWWRESSSWTCGTEKNYYKPSLYPGQNVDFYDQNGVKYRTHYINNAATSALYCYTPHAYNNPDGLYGREPYGTKGMYYSGSYNFVYWFDLWFGSPILLKGDLSRFKTYNSWRSNWDIIEAIDINGDSKDELLFYQGNSEGAVGEFYDVLSGGKIKKISTHATWRNNWDIIEAIDINGDSKDELLFYQGGTSPVAEFYEVTSSGGLRLIKKSTSWRHNWKTIAQINPVENSAKGLLFSSESGDLELYTVKTNGSLKKVFTKESFGKWDQITGLNIDSDGNEELLFYRNDSPKGFASIYEIREQDLSLVRNHSSWRGNWKNILSLDIEGDSKDELFFYSSDLGEFYEVSTAGGLTLLKTYDRIMSPLSSIVPLDVSGNGDLEIIFYKKYTGYGRAEFYDIEYLKS